MTDVVTIDPGTNPSVDVATEKVGTAEYQKLKLIDATPGSEVPTGVTANPLVVSVTNFPSDSEAGLTDTQLRATAVPVSGTIAISNFPVDSEPGLTDTQLRASSVPVTVSNPQTSVSVSNFPGTQPVSGTVTVANPTAQGITDAQLRASAIPVSGTVAVSNPQTSVAVSNFTDNGATDTQMRASALPTVLNGSGDLVGLSLIEECIKGTLPLTVTSTNAELRDPNGAQIPSDSPALVKAVASVVGQQVTIDTMGYQTLALTMGTMVANVTGCNDMAGTFGAISCFPIVLGAPVTAAAANTNYIIPCFTRYIKLTVTTVGWATYALRQQPLPVPYLANAPMNMAQINGAAVAVASAQLGINLVNINGAVHSSTNPLFASLVALATTNNQTIPAINVVTATAPAATVVKATAGRLTMLSVANGSANAAFLHLYNAASVTLTSTVSVMVFAIPAAVANYPIQLPDGGLFFSTGICYAFTGAAASLDNTALTAPTLIANLAYI